MITMESRIYEQNAGAMWEADAAAEWERINAPDPYHDQMIGAACAMSIAVDHLEKAVDYLIDAFNAVNNTPMEESVRKLLEAAEDLKVEVDMQKDSYERGERE